MPPKTDGAGYKLERFRRYYKGGKLMKSNKWTVTYKPVTEYIRRGTNPDPNAKMPEIKELKWTAEDFAAAAGKGGVAYEALLERLLRLGLGYEVEWRE